MQLKTWIFIPHEVVLAIKSRVQRTTMWLLRTGLILTGLALLLFSHGLGSFYEYKKDAVAYEASSSSFFLHGGGPSSVDGTASSSSSFIQDAAGGQAITGVASSSTSFISLKGIINLIFRTFKPKYEQIHYHWRHDDGTEATATSMTGGTQDTVITGLAKNTVKRIRLEVSNEGGQDNIAAQQFRIEYKLKSGDCTTGTYTDIGAVGGDWDMGASQLTEAGDTTNIAVATGGVTDENNSFISTNGGQRETTSQTGNITVYSNQFVELEYAIQALDAATGAAYCFRLTNAGSTTNFTYTAYPEATVSAASTITLTIDAGGTIAFGTLSYGTRTTKTTRVKIDTNSSTGYTVSVGRDRVITNVTLASSADPGSININDTENGINVFDGLGASCIDGTGPAVWPGSTGVSTGLGFVLWKSDINKETACWGTGITESDTANRYAALQASSAASTFLSTSTNSPNPSYASVGWSIEVKQLQQNTDYTGDVVFTATTTP